MIRNDDTLFFQNPEGLTFTDVVGLMVGLPPKFAIYFWFFIERRFYFFPLLQKVTKRSSPWKFDYPLTNDAKISKLAALRQLKFLRFLIVVGPSLKFP